MAALVMGPPPARSGQVDRGITAGVVVPDKIDQDCDGLMSRRLQDPCRPKMHPRCCREVDSAARRLDASSTPVPRRRFAGVVSEEHPGGTRPKRSVRSR